MSGGDESPLRRTRSNSKPTARSTATNKRKAESSDLKSEMSVSVDESAPVPPPLSAGGVSTPPFSPLLSPKSSTPPPPALSPSPLPAYPDAKSGGGGGSGGSGGGASGGAALTDLSDYVFPELIAAREKHKNRTTPIRVYGMMRLLFHSLSSPFIGL